MATKKSTKRLKKGKKVESVKPLTMINGVMKSDSTAGNSVVSNSKV
jgi:hypothetical protein